MIPIPQKWACLCCRVVLKLPRDFRPVAPPRCSRCRSEIVFAGKAFRAPKRSDSKAWRKVALMLQSGHVFHADSLGRVPDNPNALADWERRNREQARASQSRSARFANEQRWAQLQRAADWRATGKRLEREARAEES